MRYAGLTLGFVALICIPGLSQQPAPAVQTSPPANPAQPTPEVKMPDLTNSNLVVICPASDQLPQGVDFPPPKLKDAHQLMKGMKPPRLLTDNPPLPLTPEARRAFKQYDGPVSVVSVVNLLVDEQGVPQDVCVEKAIGFGLDDVALKTARQMRFRPATKGGAPVSVHVFIGLRFHN